jgi:hypothetical protein
MDFLLEMDLNTYANIFLSIGFIRLVPVFWKIFGIIYSLISAFINFSANHINNILKFITTDNQNSQTDEEMHITNNEINENSVSRFGVIN